MEKDSIVEIKKKMKQEQREDLIVEISIMKHTSI